VVGYGGFWFIIDEAHISTIAVHPDWRGQGVGEILAALERRGLSNNTSYERLRVHLFVSRETGDPRTSGFFVDTVELYSARHRNSFVEQAAEELALDRDVVKRDLGHVLLRLEALQDEQIRAALEPKPTTPPLSEPEKAAALDLLRDPTLLDRILSDFDRCGAVGEADNKVVGYLAATSRKLGHPLAVMIQNPIVKGPVYRHECLPGGRNHV